MANSFFSDKTFPKDRLTDLYTREAIIEYVNFLIAKEIPFSISMIDVDNFKYINDSYGHLVGDKTLHKVAKTINSSIGKDNVAGRFGGDEFILVFPKLVEYDAVWKQLWEIHQAIRELEINDNKGLRVTITCGLARYPKDASSYRSLLEITDKALYRGKTKGRNCFIIYVPEKHANIVGFGKSETKLSSMYLHSMIFRALTEAKHLEKGIESIFDFLGSYFMLDHICLQFGSKIKFSKVHKLSKCKSFVPIPIQLYERNIDSATEMFYMNNRDYLVKSNQTELHEQFLKYEIRACFVARVSCVNKHFGILRVDSTSGKIWQYADMDILLTTAKVLGLILYQTGRTLEDLREISSDSEAAKSAGKVEAAPPIFDFQI